jgi:hypothetical protein
MNCLQRLPLTLCLVSVVVSGAVRAQDSSTKAYSTREEYCRDNPKAPTCVNGKPRKMSDLNKAPNPLVSYCLKNPDAPECVPSNKSKAKSSHAAPDSATAQSSHAESGPAAAGSATAQGSAPAANPAAPAPGSVVPASTILTVPEEEHQASHALITDRPLAASWRFAHTNPDVLVEINAAALRQSSTVQRLLAQLTGPLQLKQSDLESRMAQAREIDECWISLRAGDPLILLQGRMDFPAGFVTMANGMASYRISKTAVVLGSESSVTAAVQRLAHARGTESPTARQMIQMAADNDFWMAGTRAFVPQAQKTPLYKGLEGYSVGISLRDGLKFALKLKYADLARATQVMTSLQNSPLPESLAHISSRIDGTTVHVGFAVDQTTLSAALDRALAEPWGKHLTAMATKSMATSDQIVITGSTGGTKQLKAFSSPPPPPPGKIVIDGLPGGRRVLN